MSSASEVLVIILSVFLAIFLVLAMVLTGYLIKLTLDIRKITKSAGKTAETITNALDSVSKFVTPMFVAEQVAKFMKNIKKDKEK